MRQLSYVIVNYPPKLKTVKNVLYVLIKISEISVRENLIIFARYIEYDKSVDKIITITSFLVTKSQTLRRLSEKSPTSTTNGLGGVHKANKF